MFTFLGLPVSEWVNFMVFELKTGDFTREIVWLDKSGFLVQSVAHENWAHLTGVVSISRLSSLGTAERSLG
jgi:hypothetical protein